MGGPRGAITPFVYPADNRIGSGYTTNNVALKTAAFLLDYLSLCVTRYDVIKIITTLANLLSEDDSRQIIF